MGGTFNPVHIGHLHLADEACRTFRPKRLLIIPSFISAHKQGCDAVSPEHRLEMLRIACADTDFEIEECELRREGVSYSIDTIRYIKEKYKLKDRPGLLIGDDLTEGFSGWKDASKVAQEARLIVACRDFHEIRFEYEHLRLKNLMLDISSSDIRTRIRKGLAGRYLLPAGVYDYIIENNLYGD